MLNRIEAETRRTKFCSEPHLIIAVDGEPLDHLLATSTGNNTFLGMIPAWLGTLSSPGENQIVWERIQQSSASNVNVPILICPDDLDLWGTVVLADTTLQDGYAWWHALGINAGGPNGLPASVGTEVNWIEGLGPFCFEKKEYDTCVAKFKANLEIS